MHIIINKKSITLCTAGLYLPSALADAQIPPILKLNLTLR